MKAQWGQESFVLNYPGCGAFPKCETGTFSVLQSLISTVVCSLNVITQAWSNLYISQSAVCSNHSLHKREFSMWFYQGCFYGWLLSQSDFINYTICLISETNNQSRVTVFPPNNQSRTIIVSQWLITDHNWVPTTNHSSSLLSSS